METKWIVLIVVCVIGIFLLILFMKARKEVIDYDMVTKVWSKISETERKHINRFKYRTRETVEAFLFKEYEEDYPDWFKEAIQDCKIKVNLSIAGLSTLTIVMTKQNDIIAHVGDMIVKIGDEITAMNIHAFIAMYEKVGE